MKDRTSTPEEPDGRAGVTTGQAGGRRGDTGRTGAGAAGATAGPPSRARLRTAVRRRADRGEARSGRLPAGRRCGPGRAAARAGSNGGPRAGVRQPTAPVRGTPRRRRRRSGAPDGNGAVAASEQPTVTGIRPARPGRAGASLRVHRITAGSPAPSGGAGPSSATSVGGRLDRPRLDRSRLDAQPASRPRPPRARPPRGRPHPSEPGPPGPSPRDRPGPRTRPRGRQPAAVEPGARPGRSAQDRPRRPRRPPLPARSAACSATARPPT